MTDRIGTAIRLATLDGEAIRDWTERGDGPCLVDGSMYSPSWRALAGGAEVWEWDEEESGVMDTRATEAYVETLDGITDELGLYWEEGCLWRSPALETYVVASPMGEREWSAEDEAHAREQHADAFGADPDEAILSVRLK